MTEVELLSAVLSELREIRGELAAVRVLAERAAHELTPQRQKFVRLKERAHDAGTPQGEAHSAQLGPGRCDCGRQRARARQGGWRCLVCG